MTLAELQQWHHSEAAGAVQRAENWRAAAADAAPTETRPGNPVRAANFTKAAEGWLQIAAFHAAAAQMIAALAAPPWSSSRPRQEA